jgi:hypothetical protein
MKGVLVVVLRTSLLVPLGMQSVGATGALAVGTCGASGYSWDAANEMLAQAAALTNCPDSKCQVYTTVRRACAALAYDPNSCTWGVASRTTLADARQSAIATCIQYGGQNCVLRASFCDSTGDTD